VPSNTANGIAAVVKLLDVAAMSVMGVGTAAVVDDIIVVTLVIRTACAVPFARVEKLLEPLIWRTMTHLVAPAALTLPFAHGAHGVLASESRSAVPSPHMTHLWMPPIPNMPTAQGVHGVPELLSVSVLPSGQALQVVEAAAAKVPCAHCRHSVLEMLSVSA
jgi:hypothetical protein